MNPTQQSRLPIHLRSRWATFLLLLCFLSLQPGEAWVRAASLSSRQARRITHLNVNNLDGSAQEINTDSADRRGTQFVGDRQDVDVKMEGYLGTDLSSIDEGKKGRVLAYIFFALLPCLLLVPFMMTREFVPLVNGGQ